MQLQDKCDIVFNLTELSRQAVKHDSPGNACIQLATAIEKLTGICLLLSSSIGDIACRTAQVAAECKRNAQTG